MELDLLLYVILIIFYLIFFVFLFVEKMEGIMLIMIFILSTFSGYKLLYDLYSSNILNINLDTIKDIYSPVLNILKRFGSIAVVLILLALFALTFTLFYFKYITNWGFSVSSVLLGISIGLSLIFQKMDTMKEVSYFSLHIVPMSLIMISFVIMMDNLAKIDKSPADGIKMSRNNRGKLMAYKIFLLLSITIIIGSLVYAVSNKNISGPSPNVDAKLAFSLIALYVTSSYTVYYANELSFIHRNKMNIQ